MDLTAWNEVAGSVFDRAYEQNGPRKHDIEEMRTDREYEVQVVEVAVEAWEGWASGCPFKDLEQADREAVVRAALDKGSFGSYRGDLPETVPACLQELGF